MVHGRIHFCLCVLAYRCLHGTAPAYLVDSLQLTVMVVGRRCLESADTIWSYLFLLLVEKLLAAVPFLWRLLVPGTLYRRLSDWRHHFMCFADVLKLNFSAIHALCDTFIFFVFCILYFYFYVHCCTIM